MCVWYQNTDAKHIHIPSHILQTDKYAQTVASRLLRLSTANAITGCRFGYEKQSEIILWFFYGIIESSEDLKILKQQRHYCYQYHFEYWWSCLYNLTFFTWMLSLTYSHILSYNSRILQCNCFSMQTIQNQCFNSYSVLV